MTHSPSSPVAKLDDVLLLIWVTWQYSFFRMLYCGQNVFRDFCNELLAPERISDVVKASQPTVDWKGLGGFRNVLVHDYLGIDLELVLPSRRPRHS